MQIANALCEDLIRDAAPKMDVRGISIPAWRSDRRPRASDIFPSAERRAETIVGDLREFLELVPKIDNWCGEIQEAVSQLPFFLSAVLGMANISTEARAVPDWLVARVAQSETRMPLGDAVPAFVVGWIQGAGCAAAAAGAVAEKTCSLGMTVPVLGDLLAALLAAFPQGQGLDSLLRAQRQAGVFVRRLLHLFRNVARKKFDEIVEELAPSLDMLRRVTKALTRNPDAIPESPQQAPCVSTVEVPPMSLNEVQPDVGSLRAEQHPSEISKPPAFDVSSLQEAVDYLGGGRSRVPSLRTLPGQHRPGNLRGTGRSRMGDPACGTRESSEPDSGPGANGDLDAVLQQLPLLRDNSAMQIFSDARNAERTESTSTLTASGVFRHSIVVDFDSPGVSTQSTQSSIPEQSPAPEVSERVRMATGVPGSTTLSKDGAPLRADAGVSKNVRVLYLSGMGPLVHGSVHRGFVEALAARLGHALRRTPGVDGDDGDAEAGGARETGTRVEVTVPDCFRFLRKDSVGDARSKFNLEHVVDVAVEAYNDLLANRKRDRQASEAIDSDLLIVADGWGAAIATRLLDRLGAYDEFDGAPGESGARAVPLDVVLVDLLMDSRLQWTAFCGCSRLAARDRSGSTAGRGNALCTKWAGAFCGWGRGVLKKALTSRMEKKVHFASHLCFAGTGHVIESFCGSVIESS